MRKLRNSFILILGLTWFSLLPVNAQDSIDITPTQITVSGTTQQTLSRSLLIHAGDVVNNVRIIPLDLKDTEGSNILPATTISIENTGNVNGLLTIIIHFNLQGVQSGRYTGDLLISYDTGNRYVPVSVNVKDPPYLPAIVLGVGVGLGLVVSEYRHKGKPRDEILVNLGQIRTQVKIDQELFAHGKAFYDNIYAELVDVEVALEAQQWEDAQKAIENARRVWNKWRKGRSDWLVQLSAYEKLNAKLDELGGNDIHYLASLRQIADDTYRKTPIFANPLEFRDQLLSLYAQTNKYLDTLQAIAILEQIGPGESMQAHTYKKTLENLSPDLTDEINQLREKIDAAIMKAKRKQLEDHITWLSMTKETLSQEYLPTWTARVNELQQDLVNLPLDEEGAFSDLAGRIKAAMEDLQKLTRPSLREDETIKPDFEFAPTASIFSHSKLVPVPDITLRSITADVANAGIRLRIFTGITYAVVVILLALAGYVELYVSKSDFGSQTVTDYLGLLAWGFGAEATRAAISEMVRSWGVVRK